jgi:DHA3 family tetracycline resistance protein-like MFS transporter
VKKLDAFPVYLIKCGLSRAALMLVFTINMVYQVTTVGLNPLQLVLVGTTLEATAFLFEVPTGIVADVISRRLSIIVGIVLLGMGFLIEGLVPHFAPILLAQVVCGVGYTFLSGAEDAWIVDEVGEEQAGAAFLRGSQAGQVGAIAGIVGSVALAMALRINVPIVAGGMLMLALAVFLGLAMPETGFAPARRGERSPRSPRSPLESMRGTLHEGLGLLRVRPVLALLLGVMLVTGLYSEGFDRLWTAHLLQNFTLPLLGALDPVVWFGVLGVVSMALSIAATEGVRRWLDMTSERAMGVALGALFAVEAGLIAAFALAHGFAFALTLLWLVDVARTLTEPIYNTWINRHIPGEIRATVLSMGGQANAIGQIAGGPAVGWIGMARSIRAALVASALLLTPGVPLALAATRAGAGIAGQAVEEAAAP